VSTMEFGVDIGNLVAVDVRLDVGTEWTLTVLSSKLQGELHEYLAIVNNDWHVWQPKDFS